MAAIMKAYLAILLPFWTINILPEGVMANNDYCQKTIQNALTFLDNVGVNAKYIDKLKLVCDDLKYTSCEEQCWAFKLSKFINYFDRNLSSDHCPHLLLECARSEMSWQR